MKESSKRGAYKGMTDARKRATDKYRAERVDQIGITVPKGKKQIIRDHATAAGLSMNQYINQAIDAQLDRDDSSDK